MLLHSLASITNGYGQPITAEGAPRKLPDPFDYGGHVNPNKSLDPALVYDIDVVIGDAPTTEICNRNQGSILEPSLNFYIQTQDNLGGVEISNQCR